MKWTNEETQAAIDVKTGMGVNAAARSHGVMLMEKNDFAQIVLLFCCSCTDIWNIYYHSMQLYIVIKYVNAMNFKSVDMMPSSDNWYIGFIWKVDNT